MTETIVFEDEEFRVQDVDYCEGFVIKIIITHPSWSLVGVGINLNAALEDLRKEAKDFYLVMVDDDPNELSPEAARFREFLIRVFGEN